MHEGQSSGVPPERPSHAVRCAWCGRILRGGRWTGVRSSAAHEVDVEAHRLRSHGICPECFHELAPGVPYPSARREEPGDAD